MADPTTLPSTSLPDPTPPPGQPFQIMEDEQGTPHRFPDNWSDEQIFGYLRQRHKLLNPPDSGPRTPPSELPNTVPGGMVPRSQPAPVPQLTPEAQSLRAMLALGAPGATAGAARSLSTLYTTDPSVIARETESREGAKQNVQASWMRSGFRESVGPAIENVKDKIREMTDDEWKKSFGQFNANEKMPARVNAPFSWGAWNSPDMAPVESQADYPGWVFGPNQGEAEARYARYNDMKHATDATVGAMMSALGKAGMNLGQMTDAKLKLEQDMLGRALLAPTRKAAMEIVNVFEDRQRGGFLVPTATTEGEHGTYTNPAYLESGKMGEMKDLYRKGTYFLDERGNINAPPGSAGSAARPLPVGDMKPSEVKMHFWPGTYILDPAGVVRQIPLQNPPK